MTDFLEGVTWFRHSSIRVRRGGVEVHVDPWGVTGENHADYVLLTHPHFDNFSEDDIARIRGPDTVVIAPSTMRRQLNDVDHFLRPGDLIQLEGIDVLAVPAHNVGRKFQPQDAGWLGYVFSLEGVIYYHAGHTDFLDSMRGILCHVAFVPCASDYTMEFNEALRTAEACGASVLVPVHWGDSGVAFDHVLEAQEIFSGEVRILDREA
jgi:L-ascorbate metabolism protein UlaG (beta-lactamase superfamily)